MVIQVAGLAGIAASSLAEGVYGAEFVAIPVQMIAALVALVIVLWTRRPTVGVVVSGWLALGPIFMPFVRDNLSAGKPALVTSTVLYMVAIGIALASGGLALFESRRSTRTGAMAEPRS
jgi:hypothetical protein